MTPATPTPAALCSGLNVVDILVRLPERWQSGEKHPTETVTLTGGAPAGNAACVLAALGVSTAFVGFFGENPASSLARDDFQRRGVRSDCFLSEPQARPGLACVTIDPRNGERTVFYNLDGYRHLRPADLSRDWLRGRQLVLADGYEAEGNLALFQLAAEQGMHRVLDMETSDQAQAQAFLRLATDAILPIRAARELTGAQEPEKILPALRAWTQAQLLITDGARGSWGLTPAGIHHQKAFSMPVVDTTGCGDAYHAAYAAALLAGWPLPERMEFAAYVAALVAGALGGRVPLPGCRALAEKARGVVSDRLAKAMAVWPEKVS